MEKKPLYAPAQGRVLVSEPFMRDSYFRRSVILLAGHDEDGSFGIILNKPLNTQINEVVTGFGDFQAPLYFGGPVKTDSLFFIHTRGEEIGNSMKIMEGIYWGGDIDEVQYMLDNQLLKQNEIRFYLGYSGWEPRQLDRELSEKSWVVASVKSGLLLKDPPESLWADILKTLGKEYSRWVNFPADPSLN
jgi:putative transcriptional regulator